MSPKYVNTKKDTSYKIHFSVINTTRPGQTSPTEPSEGKVRGGSICNGL